MKHNNKVDLIFMNDLFEVNCVVFQKFIFYILFSCSNYLENDSYIFLLRNNYLVLFRRSNSFFMPFFLLITFLVLSIQDQFWSQDFINCN